MIMNTDLNYALQITLIGMSLVFAAIVVLWGVMVLLRYLSSDNRPATDTEQAVTNQTDLKYRAAAVAVALALASQSEQNQLRRFPLPPTALVSAWQAVMRSTQLQRRRPR